MIIIIIIIIIIVVIVIIVIVIIIVIIIIDFRLTLCLLFRLSYPDALRPGKSHAYVTFVMS